MKYHFKTKDSNEFDTGERCSIIEIANRPELSSLSIAQARVKPGVVTQDHALSDTDEYYYILEGQGRATIDNETFLVKKSDVLFIPKNKSQYIENTGDSDLIFLCICSPRFEPKNYMDLEC